MLAVYGAGVATAFFLASVEVTPGSYTASLLDWPLAVVPMRGLGLTLYALGWTEKPLLNTTGRYDTASLGMTAEGNARAHELFQARPALQAQVALVMSPTFSAQLTRHARTAVPYKRRFFATTSAALAWLRQQQALTATPGTP